jgi:hypothetical protein
MRRFAVMSFRLLVVMGCLLAPTGRLGLSAAEPSGSDGRARQVKVVADRAPDCSSLKAIVQSVTRGCKTDDEKAIALYNFMLLTHYHQGYPGEKGGLGALKEINVYGWSLCGGLHTVQAALWREMGWPWRYVGWSDPGHTTVEVQYGGRWHYFDVFLRYYTWTPDASAPGGRTVASQADIKANSDLVRAGLVLDRSRGVHYHGDNRFEIVNDRANWRAPSFLSCGDTPDGILTGIRSSRVAGSPQGWAGLQFDSPGYSTDVNLAPGHSLTLTWDAIKGAHWWNGRRYVPGHGCGDKDYRNCPAIGPILEPYSRSGGLRRSYANGTLLFAPDLGGADCLTGLSARDNVRWAGGKLVPADAGRPGSVTVALESPYVLTRAGGKAEGADEAEVSLDGGKTYRRIRLADFSEEVGGQYGCLVKLSFARALTSLRLEATVQCNRTALPYLSPGKNRLTVSVADSRELGDRRLAVTCAYQLGSRTKSYEDLADAGAEVARAHGATWSARPTVVQKVFAAGDLPATFEVDVPTPEGKYPVYPRMLFLRRELLAAGAKPLPLPADAEACRPGRPEELKTLASPFTVGTEATPKRQERPTSKRTIALRGSHAVSLDGKAEENHYLKWKKGETWVMLVGGEVKDLPPARDIVSARLVLPVLRGHPKAATKVGVTLLTAPFQAGKPFDFKGLGDLAGTAVIPVQPAGGDYQPPRPFAVDVTRVVKRVAAGETVSHGFALRVVPDRSVDEGYITRLDLPRDARLQLEIEVLDRKR